jgi:hypothetical protein
MDIGTADLKSSLSATYLPIITLRNRFTGETVSPTPAERFHIGLTDKEKSDLLQIPERSEAASLAVLIVEGSRAC